MGPLDGRDFPGKVCENLIIIIIPLIELWLSHQLVAQNASGTGKRKSVQYKMLESSFTNKKKREKRENLHRFLQFLFFFWVG